MTEFLKKKLSPRDGEMKWGVGVGGSDIKEIWESSILCVNVFMAIINTVTFQNDSPAISLYLNGNTFTKSVIYKPKNEGE